jgi:hypothetical protein
LQKISDKKEVEEAIKSGSTLTDEASDLSQEAASRVRANMEHNRIYFRVEFTIGEVDYTIKRTKCPLTENITLR